MNYKTIEESNNSERYYAYRHSKTDKIVFYSQTLPGSMTSKKTRNKRKEKKKASEKSEQSLLTNIVRMHVAGESQSRDNNAGIQGSTVHRHRVALHSNTMEVLAGSDPHKVPGHSVSKAHIYAVQRGVDTTIDC